MGSADRKCGKSALVESLAAFGLAAVKFLDVSWLGMARLRGGQLRRCHWVTCVKSGGTLGCPSVGSVGARTTKKKLPFSLASAWT
jgi:hypothetical protein